MEKNQTMTDEQLARELQNGKRGGGRGKLLTVIGCAATAIGIFTSVTALTVIGIVVALLGQGVLNKHQKAAGKAVFESLVPEIMNANFEDVQPIGKQNLVDIVITPFPIILPLKNCQRIKLRSYYKKMLFIKKNLQK